MILSNLLIYEKQKMVIKKDFFLYIIILSMG